MSDRLSRTRAAVAARRKIYSDSRHEGMGVWESGYAAGLDEPSTMLRYERWFQAVESGQKILTRGERRKDGEI